MSKMQDLFDFLDDDADGYITVVRGWSTSARISTMQMDFPMQEDLMENLVGLKPAASEDEVEQLVAAISHGAHGELVGLPQLASWIDEMEDRARELRPKGAPNH